MSEADTMKGPPRHRPKALEAAKWLFETQKTELIEDPNRPRYTITSTRNAAVRFGVSKSSVARQLAALKAGKPDASTGSKPGRPSRLTDIEQKMLGFHTFMLRRDNRPVNVKVVQDAADALLSRRSPPGPKVSHSWVRRWLRADRHLARAEAMAKGASLPELNRMDAEMDNDDDDDDDVDVDEDVELEDAPSEGETAGPDVNGTSSLNLGPVFDFNASIGGEQLVNKASGALTNITSSQLTQPSPPPPPPPQLQTTTEPSTGP